MAALVTALVALAGCASFVSAVVDTTNGLRHAGFGSVSVKPVPVQGGAGNVDVSVSVNARPGDPAARGAARIVWDDLHEHFDVLDLIVDGSGPALHRHYPFDALVAMFGARNPGYDASSITSSTTSLGIDVLIGVAVVAAIAVVVVVIILVARRRRGPPPPWGGFGSAGGPVSSWGVPQSPGWQPPPQGPDGGGWGRPAPGG